MLIEFGFVFGCIDVIKFYALRRIKSTKREFCGNGFSTVRIVKRLKNGKLHIDYDDDKDIVETMVEAIASEELMELIPNFDPYNLTARQRLLVYSFVKELYDHREKYQNGTQQLTNAVSTMLLNEKYGGSSD